jgi:S-adenosylmethionine:tRNA ribosyltransferase-isomerase
LPPYLGRDDDKSDLDRYQTVYADAHKPGSSAAPTAGLHFDQAVLDDVKARGVSIAHVTLHVGPGTFLPMRGARLAEHVMHAEPWWLSDDTARILNETRARGGRVIAVGTTSVRVLESAAAQLPEGAPFVASSGLTRIFIQPGFQFRVVDGLITNFHLPESTLLVLVSALVGRTRILDAYNEAIAHGYRFYSYGDASLLWRATGH